MEDNSQFPKGLSSFSILPGAKGAMVICPGGAYQMLADREAEPVAAAFAEGGWQPFVLRYPVKDCKKKGPLSMEPLVRLAETVVQVRSLGFSRVAVCGFSAGGHLAGSLGVHWKELDHEILSADSPETPAHSCRPDGLVLSYPVISMINDFHQGSMENLTGGDLTLRKYFSLEDQVKQDTSPAFLWHTAEDRDVPVENSLMFFSALRKAGVVSELHIFPKGEHGLSLATPEVDEPEKNRLSDAHVAEWFTLALGWLEQQDSL